MKYAFTSLLLIVLLYSISYSQDKAFIAVLELEAGGISAYEAQVLSSRLRTELFKTDKFTVLERDKMDEILIEQGFQLSACTTNECAVEVGKLIGVEKMVAGNIAKIDNLFTIDIRLLDVETGKVLKTATEDCACELKDVLTNSIRNVARGMAGLKVEDKTAKVKTYQSNIQNNSNAGLSEWVKLGLSRDEYLDFKKSSWTLDDWLDYQSNSKSPTLALLFSFIIPGTGQYYNGDFIKGVGQQALIVGAFALGVSSGKNENSGGEIIAIGTLAGTWLWSWLDARSSAINHNEELKKKYKLSFTPKLNKYSNQPMLSLNIEF